ncbi:MAG: hypothetical protein PUB00_03900 [Clostridiales bacterium]|nr:hypothetical protein [Clostridiales bacterium]
MQTIIQQIIEIDKMAQQKYIDAEAYQQKAEQDTLEEIKKMDIETQKNSNDKLNRMRENQNVMLAEKIGVLSEKLAEQKKRLDHMYEQHHEKWEHDLFQKVLKK